MSSFTRSSFDICTCFLKKYYRLLVLASICQPAGFQLPSGRHPCAFPCAFIWGLAWEAHIWKASSYILLRYFLPDFHVQPIAFLWRKREWSCLYPQIGGLDVFTVDGMQVACRYFPSMIAHCYLPLIVHLSEAGKKIRCFCFWISKIFVTLHLWKVAGRSWGHGTEEHVAWVWHRRQHRRNKKNICNGIYVKGRLRQTRIRT